MHHAHLHPPSHYVGQYVVIVAVVVDLGVIASPSVCVSVTERVLMKMEELSN